MSAPLNHDLTAFALGEGLSDVRRDEIARLVQSDAAIAAEVAALRDLHLSLEASGAWMRQHPSFRLPPAMRAAIRSTANERSSFGWPWWRAFLAGAGSCAALAFALVWWLGPSGFRSRESDRAFVESIVSETGSARSSIADADIQRKPASVSLSGNVTSYGLDSLDTSVRAQLVITANDWFAPHAQAVKLPSGAPELVWDAPPVPHSFTHLASAWRWLRYVAEDQKIIASLAHEQVRLVPGDATATPATAPEFRATLRLLGLTTPTATHADGYALELVAVSEDGPWRVTLHRKSRIALDSSPEAQP